MRGFTARLLVPTMAATALAVAFGATHAHAQRDRFDRIRCESSGGRDQFCRASIGGDVRVVRQLSNTRCVEGRNWRWDRNGITVRDGCRAEFEFRRDSSGGSWGGGGGSWGSGGGSWGGGGRRDIVTCQSQRGREQFCPAAIDGDVRVNRQLSDEPCVFRRNWNWNRDGVRVFEGCRAEFSFRPREGGSAGPGGSGRVTCQSNDGRASWCPAAIGGDVRVFRNISDVRCREGVNFSWNNDGVRVWNGCRAEFEFRRRN